MSLAELDTLRTRVIDDTSGEDAGAYTRGGYAGIALCVLDAIYSTGHHYPDVLRVLDNYRGARRDEGGDPDHDGPNDLIDAVARWDGIEGFVGRTDCRWRTSTSEHAPYKATVALSAAHLLRGAGLDTVDAVREAMLDPDGRLTDLRAVAERWRRLPGTNNDMTWSYFLMLAGVPGISRGPMVTRYVARVLGRPVSGLEAASLIGILADEHGTPRATLARAIWRVESGQKTNLVVQPAQ